MTTVNFAVLGQNLYSDMNAFLSLQTKKDTYLTSHNESFTGRTTLKFVSDTAPTSADVTVLDEINKDLHHSLSIRHDL
jgi:hypothetical protein